MSSCAAAVCREFCATKPLRAPSSLRNWAPSTCAPVCPIVYTSADSVFQIAAHEEVIPLERQYEICRIARELLVGEHAVARVIARPFLGEEGSYARTTNRRDFSLLPWEPTILGRPCAEAGVEVVAIGKIFDLFAGQGMERHIASKNNAMGVDRLLEVLAEMGERDQLILLNLVDFDMLWGHAARFRGLQGRARSV